VGELVALGGAAAVAPGEGELLGGAAGGGDGGFGALGERVRLHGDRAGQLAAAEDLDQRALVHETVLVQRFRRDLVQTALLERVEVDGLVLDAERVVEALQLRQPHVQRHLATLETNGHGVARALALGAAAGGLAALAADAPTDALALLERTR